MSPATDSVALIPFFSVKDPIRGTLCVAEYEKNIPFEIKRIFYLYDLPVNTVRGEHAHRTQEQVFICIKGSVEISTERDGHPSKHILNRPEEGLYLPTLTWMRFRALDKDTVCLVLCSGIYDEDEYIRDRNLFLETGKRT